MQFVFNKCVQPNNEGQLALYGSAPPNQKQNTDLNEEFYQSRIVISTQTDAELTESVLKRRPTEKNCPTEPDEKKTWETFIMYRGDL